MDDIEIEKIKEKQLQEMINKQKEIQAQSTVTIPDLDATNFDDTINNNSLVLVDFWAEWCGPCKSMHPIFERVSKKYLQIKFARVNIDNAQSIAQRFSVQSIPTFIMFKDGNVAQQMVGAVGEPGIHMIAKKFLNV